MLNSVRAHVALLIHELGGASSRPLYVELALIRSKEDASRHLDATKSQAATAPTDSTPSFKTATTTKEDEIEVEKRTWEEVRQYWMCSRVGHGTFFNLNEKVSSLKLVIVASSF